MYGSTNHIIFVAAGHIDIAFAHYLVADNCDITVIDQSDIGRACSRANYGFLVPSHIMPLTTPDNLTAADVHFDRAISSLEQREKIKKRTIAKRCSHYQRGNA